MSKRRELEARKQDQQRKQTIQIAVIIGAIALVVIGAAVVFTTINRNPATQSGPTLPAAVASTKPLPANIDSVNRAWGPADAPIKVEEYIDYQCPACGQFARSFEPGVIEAFANSGKVRYEVKFMPFLEDRVNGRESRDAAQASMCAADQGKFWEMHNTLFTNQLITGQENVGNYSKVRLKQMADTVPGMEAVAFGQCLDSNKHEATVLAIRKDGEARNVQSTPSFYINGQPNANVRSADDFRKAFAQAAPNVTIP